MAEEGEQGGGGDPRIQTLQQFTLKAMKQKSDKWAKMVSQEDNVMMLTEFLEKGENQVLVIYATPQGQLTPASKFPNTSKTKAVYFVKRHAEPVKKDNFKSLVMFGDISHLPLYHLTSLVETLLVPVIANNTNHRSWPGVVSRDVMTHVGG